MIHTRSRTLERPGAAWPLGISLVWLGLASAAFAAPGGPLEPTNVRDALAVNIHFLVPRPGEMDLLKGTGVGRVRMDAAWHRVEKERGLYDFGALDGLMRELDVHGLRALLILDYGNSLYAGTEHTPPINPEARAAFVKYAAATVAHFKGRGVIWEIYNEPNNKQFWPPTPDGKVYAELARDVAAAVRAAAPGEVLVGPGLALIDKPFFTKAVDAGLLDAVDAVTVHPYRQTAPETFGDELAWLRKTVADRGKRTPIIAGEWGYPVVWVDATTQVNYLARQMLWGLSERLPLNVWYDWRRGFGYDGKFSIFGLVDPIPAGDGGYTLKTTALYDALSGLTRLLGDARFAERLPLDVNDARDAYLLAFDGPAGRRYAFWTSGAEREARIRLPAGTYELYDVFGRDVGARGAGANGLDQKVSDSPRYAVRTGDAPTTSTTTSPAP